MKKIKIIGLIVLIVALVVVVGVLIGFAVHSNFYNKDAKNPVLTLNIEGYGEVQIELYPDYAPNTVSTIIKLAQNKYYDGKVFYGTDGTSVHAGMIRNEVSQEDIETPEGDVSEENAIEDAPTVVDLDASVANGSEADYKISIAGEFVANGYERNTLRFEKGIVGLFRPNYMSYIGTDLSAQSYNAGNSLFFISMEENSQINGLYTPFGKVVKGFDIIEKINTLKTVEVENAQEGQIEYFESLPSIKTATVDTFGVDYGMPEYIEAFDYNSYLSNELLQYYQNQ